MKVVGRYYTFFTYPRAIRIQPDGPGRAGTSIRPIVKIERIQFYQGKTIQAVKIK
jgi:hypothetical protein